MPLTRRDALRKLFGREAPEAAARRKTQELLRAYLELLDRRQEDLPWGVPFSALPGDPAEIREGLLEVAAGEPKAGARDVLRDAYTSLVWFVSEEDVALMRAGRKALETNPDAPQIRDEIVAAFTRRSQLLAGLGALQKEFDRIVEERATRVRRAETADADRITEIETHRRQVVARRSGGEEPSSEDVVGEVRAWLESPDERVHVVTVAERVAGFCRLSIPAGEPPSAEVLSIAVDSRVRRKGRGRKLLEHVTGELVGEDALTLLARVGDEEPDARPFLEAVGFTADPPAPGETAQRLSRRLP